MSEVAVRVNAVSSGMAGDDILSVMKCSNPPSAMVVPKVDTVDEVDWVSDQLCLCNNLKVACFNLYFRLISKQF